MKPVRKNSVDGQRNNGKRPRLEETTPAVSKPQQQGGGFGAAIGMCFMCKI